MRHIFLALITLLLSQSVLAGERETSNYYFSHITSENGLSQSNIKSIIQDSYGFMWFGTKNGLNRYDGTSICTINCDDYVTGKGNHNISALYEDCERKLWVGTDKGVFIYDPVTEIFTSLDIVSNDGLQINNWIAKIRSDNSGNIWIIAPTQGVFRYKNGKMFHYYITDVERYNLENPQCICIRKNGEVWIGTNHSGLYLYDEKNDSFRQYISDKDGKSLKSDNIFALCEYGDCIVVAVHEGELKKYDTCTNTLSLVNAPEVHYSLLRDVACYNDKELWVATQTGLFVINESNSQVTHVTEDPMHPYGLSDKAVCVIYRDREGGMWLGTLFGGVNYSPNPILSFEKYVPLNQANSLSSKRIREIVEDSHGRIWIGTEDEGIDVLDPKTGTVKPVGYDFMVKNNCLNTLAMLINGDELWCGSFKRGLSTLQLSSGAMKYYTAEDLNLDEASVYALYKDRKNRIWLGSARGVYMAEPGSYVFKKLVKLGYYWIVDIMEDRDGILWFASLGQGLCRYDILTDEFTYYVNEKDNSNSLSSNTVSSIMQDSKGYIWLSTDRGGICRYDKQTDQFTTYSTKDGLPDDVAYAILEDNSGNLWFGTNRGLVKFNPERREIRVYTRSDGLLGNQFNYKSALKGRDGMFYFGGIDGLVAFNPEQKAKNTIVPPIYITRFSIYDKEVSIHDANSSLEKSIIFTDKIVLSYNQSTISLDFVALSFSSPEANQYMYTMENLDENWIKAGNTHNITYSKLPPGDYKFRVKAVNHDASWKEVTTSIDIIILPPWWLSMWAYVIYVLLFVCSLLGGLYWYKRRRDKQLEESRKVFEMEKEKELYVAKVDFFTEIAHEVRTPLTLINGPLETILEMDIKEPKVVHNLQVMAQNTKRLLELTRQLLDFRKVGANKFVMDFIMVDINHLLSETVSRFEPTILQKQKTISLSLPEEALNVAIDKEAVTKILSNLLNNALKYSLSTINIELLRDKISFSIRVISDGDRISKDLSQRIFEPFYQIDKKEGSASGAGIGLPLARSLAELHHGSLYLDADTALNTFVLTLPLNQEQIIHLKDYMIQDECVQSEESEMTNSDVKEYIILLVEDNIMMQSFISEKLQEDFMVLTALNGVEALDILREQTVDLIVSDLMMPEMDGMKLCEKIKSDIELSHIPFIFLTAKNDLDSKIEGLKAGAEAYVEKPFSYNYLRTQVLTLLNNRRKEREAFSKRPFFPVHKMKMNKADEEFMDKIIGIIHSNITDDNFSVERLAEILCMSRSSLLRKIKVLSNLSAVDFIKLIRLKKAAELIQEGKYRIGEICYMVGINSPSYFSKLFQKQFGVTPKDFEKKT